MSQGPVQVYTCGIASGASTSSYVDLGGKSYTKLAVNVVTMSTNAMVTVYGANAATDTFLPIFERVNTAPVQHQAVTIATSTSGSWVELAPPVCRYVKFITSGVVSGGVSFVVLAQD